MRKKTEDHILADAAHQEEGVASQIEVAEEASLTEAEVAPHMGDVVQTGVAEEVAARLKEEAAISVGVAKGADAD